MKPRHSLLTPVRGPYDFPRTIPTEEQLAELRAYYAKDTRRFDRELDQVYAGPPLFSEPDPYYASTATGLHFCFWCGVVIDAPAEPCLSCDREQPEHVVAEYEPDNALTHPRWCP